MFAITTIVAVGTFLVTYALRALGWELTLTFVGVLAIIATTAESPRLLDHFRLEKQHRTIGLAAISIVILIETMLGILLVFQAVRYAFFGAP